MVYPHGKSERVVHFKEAVGNQHLPLEKVVSSIEHYLSSLELEHTIPHIQIVADINLFLISLFTEGFFGVNLPDALEKAEKRLFRRKEKLGPGGIYKDHEIVPSVSALEYGQILNALENDLKTMKKNAHFFAMDQQMVAHLASEWLKHANAMYRSGKWLSLSKYPEQALNKIALVTSLLGQTAEDSHFDHNLLEDVGVLERMVATYKKRIGKKKGRAKVTYTPSNIRTQVNLLIHDLKPFQERRKHG